MVKEGVERQTAFNKLACIDLCPETNRQNKEAQQCLKILQSFKFEHPSSVFSTLTKKKLCFLKFMCAQWSRDSSTSNKLQLYSM